MSEKITFTIDGKKITAKDGDSILEAAEANGLYIPRLCHLKGLIPYGSCRVCSVKMNGRMVASCTQPVEQGSVVESESEEVNQVRRDIIDMLFIEGNHFCMFCEKSGNCELQAQAYRLGMTAPKYPFQFPDRPIDMSHPDAFIDHDRCILCARCVRTSRDKDGKHVFDFVGRSINKRVAVNSPEALKGTDLDKMDKAINACPVGALMPKRVGFKVPVGKREYDTKPIGSDIENSAPANN
jgi:[NiFe] hydrogenase diaphorase moiety small subunit